jgi:glycosyltransferase involved in cell wall biosynthesis
MNASPIRICRVIARMNVGGPAVHVTQLTSGLNSKRFEQLVVAGLEGPSEASMLPQARARGVEPIIIPEFGREVAPRDDAIALLKLHRLFRAWRPDIVETHTAKAGTLGRLAALLAGVPVRIHVFHGHVFHGYFGRRKTRLFLEIERALARVTTRVVALGEHQRRELLEYGIGTPEKIVSIPLGFDLDPFLDAQRTGRLRSTIGAPQAPLLGIVARLVPIKRLDLFLETARLVLDEFPEAHFVVVGDGELRAALQRQASQPSLAGRVHFLGWRSPADLPEIYADLDLVLLTSDNEGMPVSLIEAMAASRAVVATDVGGVRSVVRDGATGLLAPRGDTRALARACIRLLCDPALRHQLGAAGREAVYPQFDRHTLLERMDRLYRSVLPLDSRANA